MNCTSFKKYAFEGHVDCFTNPGYESKGICQIALTKDMFEVLNVFDKATMNGADYGDATVDLLKVRTLEYFFYQLFY